MTTTHTLYSASSLDRLALCPPSARMGKDIEDKPSKDAERGTRIHKLGERFLLGQDLSDVLLECDDEEEFKIAKAYAEYVWELAGDNGEICVEESFHDALSIYHPDLGGTGDAVVVFPRELHVIDLKSGRSPVRVTKNKQLLTYGLGAIEKRGWQHFDKVHLHIFQPGNTEMVTYTVDELKAWIKELTKICERADDPFEKPNPSPKACHFCKAKTICPAIREKVLESAKQDFIFEENNLERLLDEAKLALTWGEAVQEQAKGLIADGLDAGHWYLKNGRKMVSYKDKVGAEAFFAGNPLAFEIKSPSALKKAGIEVPEQYLEEKISAPSLVRKD